VPITTPVATGRKAMTSARGDAKASSSSRAHHDAADDRQVNGFGLDLVAAHHREHRRAAQQQLGLGLAHVARGGVEGRVHLRDGHGLRVEVAAGGARGGDHQRARRVRDIHTPSSLRGALAGTSSMAMRWVSPVGSRSRNGLITLPAGVPSIDSVSLIASRRPSAVNCPGRDAGRQLVAVLEHPGAGLAPVADVAVLDQVEELALAHDLATARDTAARCSALPPSMPSISVREATPLCSCSISTRWRRSGLLGRKAERSAPICVRAMTTAPHSSTSSHASSTTALRRQLGGRRPAAPSR
jgi:hypothetical protein